MFVNLINLPLSTCQALKEHGSLERDVSVYESTGNYLTRTLIRVTAGRAPNPACMGRGGFLGSRGEISYDLKDE